MNTLIVGDVHGIVPVVENALTFDGRVVFLGDLVDSFDRTLVDQLECVGLVLDAVDEGKAELLIGNHELSYLYPGMECSGFKYPLRLQLESSGLLSRLRRHAKTHIWITSPGVEAPLLASHAGFSRSLDLHLPYLHFSLFALPRPAFDKRIAEAAEERNSWLYESGRKRGGRSLVGGPFWCDLVEFVPVPGLNQVFGHTPLKEPFVGQGYTCINVQDGKFVGMVVDEEGKFVSWRKVEGRNEYFTHVGRTRGGRK